MIRILDFYIIKKFLTTFLTDSIKPLLVLNTFFGKFIVLSLCWTFSFHILNEIRHLMWDIGYGFDLKIANITGFATLFGSFILTILLYLIGKNFF